MIAQRRREAKMHHQQPVTVRRRKRWTLLDWLLLLLLLAGITALFVVIVVTQVGAASRRSLAAATAFRIESKHTLLLHDTLTPAAGDHDVITVVLHNLGTVTLRNVSVTGRVTTTAHPPAVAVSMLCSPSYSTNVLPVMIPGQKAVCRTFYVLTQADVDALATITATFTATPPAVSNSSSISLETLVGEGSGIALSQDVDEAGFLSGDCNGTAPVFPTCDSTHYTWTFLCIDQQTLYVCNASGWSPYFVLAISNGGAAISTTTSSFIQPVCSAAVTVHVDSTAWMVVGETVFIEGGGYYIVADIIDATTVSVINPCFDGNAMTGATVGASPAAVGPAGQQGPSGPSGPTGPPGAITSILDNYVQPSCDTSVTVSVADTSWMAPGLVIFVGDGGGYYTVLSVVNGTSVILYNPCFSENASPGTTINAPAIVLPVGPQGQTGPSGPSGGTGPEGPTGPIGPSGGTPTTPPAFNGTADVVVVGDVLAYSTDGGSSFTTLSIADFGLGNDVAYSLALNRWVVVGSGSITALYSNDGGNWATSSLTSLLDTAGYAVAWSDAQALWVAGGAGIATIATSTNGIDWISRISPFTGSVRGIAYSPQRNIWVAVGNGGALVARSVDGINWIATVVFEPIFTGSHVSWGAEAGIFLLSMFNGGVAVSTARSHDGVEWMFDAAAFQPQSIVTGSVWNVTKFLVTGSSANDTLMTSTDGIAFVGQGKSLIQTVGYGVCLASEFQKVFLVGISAAGSIVSIADDGSTSVIDLTDMVVAKRCFARYTSVANVSSPAIPSYVADFVSTGQGTNTLGHSLDGGKYFNPGGATIFVTAAYSVAYSLQQTRWVAVGQGSYTGAYSSNGLDWTPSTSLTSILTVFAYDVAWSANQSQWVAGGNGGSFKIATSPDGITWTGRSSTFNTAVFGIAYSPARNRWVACGSSAVLGNAIIAYSTDAVTWTTAFYVYNNIAARRVTWVPELGLFVAMLNGGSPFAVTMATSVNGIAWSSEANAFQITAIGYGIAWNGTALMLTGQGNADTIQTSTDGITVSGLGHAIFTTIGNDVCYGVDYGKWIFGGQGTLASFYSLSPSSDVSTFAQWPFTTAGFKCAARYSIEPTFVVDAGPTVLADFVITGNSKNGAAYSINGGRTFTPVIAASTSVGSSAAYSPEQQRWVLGFGAGAFKGYYSSDGIIWTGITSLASLFPSNGVADVVWSRNQSKWVCCAGGNDSFEAATSPDGITWTGHAIPGADRCGGLAYSPELDLYAMTLTTTQTGLATSPDGVTWTLRSSSIFGTGITWAKELGIFIAGGQSTTTIISSTDGITWSNYSTSPFVSSSQATSNMLDIKWNGTHFFAVGGGTNHTIAHSADGISWTGIGKTLLPQTGSRLCYGTNYHRWVFSSLGTAVATMSSISGGTTSSFLFDSGGSRCAARET
jgi:hypothetical protein